MDLDSPISDLPKVGPILTGKFEKIGVSTLEDLFYHVPSRYMDYSQITTINRVRAGEVVTIHANIVSLKNIYSRRGLKMQIGSVEDATGKLSVIWFNQPFLIKTLYPGRMVSLSGKVGFFSRRLCLSSPDYELIDADEGRTLHTGRLVPVYPETSGLSSKWIRRVVLLAFESGAPLTGDFLAKDVLARLNLIDFASAIRKVHFPEDLNEAEKGRERLAFDELLKLQLKSQLRKFAWKKNKSAFKLTVEKPSMKQFTDNLPFELTASQKKAVDEIVADMTGGVPMNRLLEISDHFHGPHPNTCLPTL